MDAFNNSEFVIPMNVPSNSQILAFIVITTFLEVL